MTSSAADGRGSPAGVALSILGALAFVFAWFAGVVLNALTLGLLVHVVVGIIRRAIAVIRRQFRSGWLRRPLAREHRAQLVRCLVNWFFLAVIAIVLHVSIVPEQLEDDYSAALAISAACIVIAALLELVPVAPPRTAKTVIIGLLSIFLAVQLLMILRAPEEGAVVLEPPLAQELLVMQGGQSPLINHHYVVRAQRQAVDLVVVTDNRIHVEGATGNHASACFGKAVLAPAAGRIVRASDQLADMPPGKTDESHLVGNHVVIELGPRRYVLLAHLRAASLRVKLGDQVTVGQPLAECGNSGNTSEAHVHIQVQDAPDFSDDVTTFPIQFRHVVRGGRPMPTPISVRRNDRLATRM